MAAITSASETPSFSAACSTLMSGYVIAATFGPLVKLPVLLPRAVMRGQATCGGNDVAGHGIAGSGNKTPLRASAPTWTRTRDPRLRRPTLDPAPIGTSEPMAASCDLDRPRNPCSAPLRALLSCRIGLHLRCRG